MTAICGKKCHIIVSVENGETIEFDGLGTSCTLSSDIGMEDYGYNEHFKRTFPTKVEYSLSVIGIPKFVGEVEEFSKTVTNRMAQMEWMCNFCGTPNPKKHRTCSQCGAPRSFLYDI